MARKLTTDKLIDDFIVKALKAANHHGGEVQHVIQPLSDEVRKRLNLNFDKVEVYERNGNLARTCWVTINGKRYVFSYKYKTKKIELRDKSTQGTRLATFDNSTSLSDIQIEVAKL